MTDSSKRFENSFTVQHCKEALSYLYTHILQSEIAGTSTSHAFAPLFNNSDTYKEEIHSIHVSHDHITRVLGTAITQDEIQKILLGLRMSVSAENGIYTVEPPSDRMDIAIQEDVIEEVGRMYGYHNIPSRSLDDIEYQPQVHPETALEMTLRNICIEHGFSEVMTYSFEKKGDTYVHNPVAKDKPALRKNLTNGMAKSLEKNVYYADLLGLDSVRIFQWGRAFTKDGEKIHCALGVAHVDKKARKKYGQPHEILNTLISEINSTCGLTIPHATEKDNGIIEIDITQIIHEKNPLLPTTYTQIINTLSETTFSSLSPYPHSVRDISVWVPEHISANTVSESIDESTSEIMVRMDLFDTFTKDEKTSYAFRMVFQSMEKTLTDTEVDNEMKSIEQAFSKKGWEIR